MADLREKFWSLFEPSDQLPRALGVRDFAKTFFDYLRNVTIVGALKLLAEKSQSTIILAISIIAMAILWAQTISYIYSWKLKLFRQFVSGKKGEVLDGVVDLLLAILVSGFLWITIQIATNAIAITPKP